MSSMTRLQFQNNVLSFMDADASNRWSPAIIQSVGGIVTQNEWSDILNQNQYYRFAMRSVTTDANGQIAISALDSGSGDATQNFYRLIGPFTDGNVMWTETDYRYVPLATQTNYPTPFQYAYYLAGDYFQLLPVATGTALTVAINHTPPTIAELAGDTSVIVFPSGYEWIPVWVTAATLLLKGGAESQAASDLYALADSARKNMLGDIARLSSRPTFALYQDTPGSWGG